MKGQAKIELMLTLKNKIRAGLNQAKQDTFKSVNTMQAKMNSLKFNIAKNSKNIANEVPIIGNAFRLASNPIALTAAGVLAIGKGDRLHYPKGCGLQHAVQGVIKFEP